MEFDDVLTHFGQHGGAAGGQVVVLARARAIAGLHLASQPPVALHAPKQRIERSWTDVVAVAPQLLEDPLSKQRMFRRVVEDVHFPETQKDLSREQLGVAGRHGVTLQRRPRNPNCPPPREALRRDLDEARRGESGRGGNPNLELNTNPEPRTLNRERPSRSRSTLALGESKASMKPGPPAARR